MLLTTILLAIHFALLLRQSLLLLRPQSDLLYNAQHARPEHETLALALATKIWAVVKPKTLLKRIEHHGSGAALAALPLLLLLFYQPPKSIIPKTIGLSLLGNNGLIVLQWHPFKWWLFLLWFAVSFLALLATRLQHFNSLGISSRDTTPADFGRRWPLWPDGILWLCELVYLGFLFITLYNLSQLLGLAWFVLIFALPPLLYIYWRNWHYYKVHYLRPMHSCIGEISSFEAVASGLYLLRLKLTCHSTLEHCFSKKLGLQCIANAATHHNINQIALPMFLPMGFYILHFPKQKGLARSQQNEHPLSLLRYSKTESKIELEFALEMQGFLEYLPSSAFVNNTVQVWGPYYDAQPQFIKSIFNNGRLLYIGSGAGLSPLLNFLEYLKMIGWQEQLQIAVLHLSPQNKLEKLGLETQENFWNQCLKAWQNALKASGSFLPQISLQIQEITIAEQFAISPYPKLPEQKKAKKRTNRRLIAWQNFRTQRESEILEWEIASYLSKLCNHWQMNTKELQQNCLYRGPYSLRKLIEQCFDENLLDKLNSATIQN